MDENGSGQTLTFLQILVTSGGFFILWAAFAAIDSGAPGELCLRFFLRFSRTQVLTTADEKKRDIMRVRCFQEFLSLKYLHGRQ